jgi:hypothetical protein
MDFKHPEKNEWKHIAKLRRKNTPNVPQVEFMSSPHPKQMKNKNV